MTAQPDPASIRDPGGRVFQGDGRILRAVYQKNVADYEAARNAGLLERLIDRNWLLASAEIDPSSSNAGDGAAYLLEHPRLPFISYPYEWPFTLHKKAALLQLDILLEALDRGFTLSDASAYNIQFLGTEPRFIDHLSFVRYQDGSIWNAHRQFCMQFLNPLIMWAKLGVSPNSWFRGSLEGIAPEELSRLLRWRDLLSLTMTGHVIAQGAMQRRANADSQSQVETTKLQLSRHSFRAMLEQLRSFISSLRGPHTGTVWSGYDIDNSYDEAAAATKRRFVQTAVEKIKPNLLIDLGCNTGEYSIAALDAGAAYVAGFDFDFGALERAVARSEKGGHQFLPLWLDATNPSPSQGWAQRERSGFGDRAHGDAVLALAFVHHLVIARNVPMELAVDWIMSMAPAGVIEFPTKSDPMVQVLLSQREDIFPDYGEVQFLAAITRRGRVVATERLSAQGRVLVWYNRGE